MPDIEMCLSVRCPVSVFCRRHRDSGTVPGVMQAYGYHDPDENGRCDMYMSVLEERFPGASAALARHATTARELRAALKEEG